MFPATQSLPAFETNVLFLVKDIYCKYVNDRRVNLSDGLCVNELKRNTIDQRIETCERSQYDGRCFSKRKRVRNSRPAFSHLSGAIETNSEAQCCTAACALSECQHGEWYLWHALRKRQRKERTVNIRLYALQLYVTCYITGRIAIDNFHGNHRQISRSSSGMQPRQGELEKRDGFVAHCTHRCERTVIRPSTDDADNCPGPHRRRRHRHRLHRLLPHSGCPAT